MKVRSLTRTLSRRGAALAAILLLLFVLVLAACGRGNADTGSNLPTATPTLPPTDQVIQLDAQIDDIFTAMDSASKDAALDESAKDTVVVP